MRKLQIHINEQQFAPGETVEGQILVTCDDDFQCERLFITLHGRELARVVIHAGKVTIVHEEKRDHIDHCIDLDEDLTIPMGESRYDFSFTLPPDIPGSYKGPYGSISYTVEAKAEISWARDLKSKQDITLAFNSEIDAESVPGPKSDFIEKDGVVLVKADTTRDRFTLGREVYFRFYVDRETKMRGIRAEIIGLEHVEPKGHKMNTKRSLAEIYYTDDEIRRDSWTEVKIPADVNWTESFTTDLIQYTHILKVTLDVARRRDKDIEIPIVLTRSESTDAYGFDF